MLKELIDQFYLENQKNNEQTRFYITDAGKCPRAIFFKFKNAPREPLEPRIMRIFEHGENIHRSIFNILYRLRMGVVTEVPIPSQEIISGRADAILCMGSENYVLDIKSINSMLFRKLTAPKVEKNILPARLEDYPRNWQCSYCAFKDICKMANGEEIDWEDFKKKVESQPQIS